MPSVVAALRSVARSGRVFVPLGVIAAVVAIVAPSCRPSQAQTAPALTPVMLKRIAEALDGNRTGEQVYVVVSTEPTNEVLGVVTDRRAADELVKAAEGKALVAGRFQTEKDLALKIAACVHDGINSRLHTDKCVGPILRVTLGEITAMNLVLTRSGGAIDTLAIPPGADAIFLSMPAIDKFAIPYYLRTIGLQATGEMRSQLQQVYSGPNGPRP